MRSVLKWVSRHRALSAFCATATLVAAALVRSAVSRSNGTLTEPLQRGRIVESVYGIGTVRSNRSFQVKLGVISTINALYVEEGDSVKRGDRLAKIDQIVYRAPFGGTVTFLPFKEGENVFTNLPILSLVDLRDRYLAVSLEQQGALRVKRGQKVRISFDSIREQSYEGKVQSVYSNDNNFLARIDVSGLPESILPWMTADVAIEISERESALLVPVAALDRGSVWVKRGRGIPYRVEVRTGVVDKSVAEILSGDIRPGDRLLIRKRAGT